MVDGVRHADLMQPPDWNENLANAFETPVTVLIPSTRTKIQSALRASELGQTLRGSTL